MAAVKKTTKQNGYGEKQTVRVITVDKERRRVECAMRDGAMIWAAIWETDTIFRWPEVGEIWTVRQDTGVWRLDKIVQSPLAEEESSATPKTLGELPEGDTRVLGNSVHLNTLVAQSVISVTTDLVINVKAYGAKGDGIIDDTDAIKKAMAALGVNGGTLFFPYGVYKISEQLNFDGTHSVRLVGVGGLSGGVTTASTLRFIQSGSSALISARSTGGFNMADIYIQHSSATYTGAMLDLTHNGEGAFDSAYTVIERCNFGTISGAQVALGIDLNKAIIFRARDCHFGGLNIGARGQVEPGSYSNEINFDGCTFIGMGTASLKNPGEAWNIVGCTFEALHSGAAGALLHDPNVFAKAVTVSGCWMGDITGTATSSHIDFYGSGLTVTGNLIGGNTEATVTGVKVLDTLSEGIVITGNRFDSTKNGVTLGSGVERYIIGANMHSSVTKKVSLDGGSTDAGAGLLSN